MSFIEDEDKFGYTIRTDRMHDGESVQCHEDKDMKIKKEKGSVILVKKCFIKHCFSK